MAERCAPAQAKRLAAVYVLGQLVLAAEGQKPNPCHRVRFEQSPLAVEPPRFFLNACVDDGAVCPQVVVPYQTLQVFAIGSPRDSVLVTTMSGDHELPVLVVDDPSPLAHMQPASLVPYSALPEDRRNAVLEQRWPTIGPRADDPTALASLGALALPLRISGLFDGLLEVIPVSPRRAVGYSDTWNFEEAFSDAIRNLPPLDGVEVDHLTTVRVTAMGAQVGGFAGFNRLFVAVVAQ